MIRHPLFQCNTRGVTTVHGYDIARLPISLERSLIHLYGEHVRYSRTVPETVLYGPYSGEYTAVGVP